MGGAGAWMRGDLTTQGYCLSDAERRELALGLLFSTGLCLSLVVVALALEAPAMVFALSAIAVVASFSARRATVTATNLCLPSEAFAWWARHTQRKHAITT